MKTEVVLGEIDLPDGILLILDPGLARYWRHDADPRSPRKNDRPEYDLVIVGDDARAAGKAYDREFDPLHLFDRSDPEVARKHFDEFAADKGFRATAELLDQRLPHTERARLAIAAGDGLGVVKYNGLWAVVVGGLPSTTGLRVVGVPLPEGEFAGRWEFIDIIVDDKLEVARQEQVNGVMVDYGQLLFAGLEPLGQFRMWESLDGLADLVFWGPDAARLAGEVGAEALDGEQYGWKDLPVDAIGDRAQSVQQRIDDGKLRVGVDYRPHCNLERLNAALRASDQDAAEILLDGSRVVGCGNRWGDGIFSVSRLLAADGSVARLRVNLGTEERKKTMRQVRIRALGAIVTRAVLDDGEPIRFAERTKPDNQQDSGWFFCAGTEDQAYMGDATNFAVVRVATLVEMFPEVAEILDAPDGAKFRRDGERMVADDQ